MAIAASVLALAGGVRAAQTIRINGAGATFPNPIYSKWFSEYNKLKPQVEINYQSSARAGESGKSSSRPCFSARAMDP